jgi:hypothetical protein
VRRRKGKEKTVEKNEGQKRELIQINLAPLGKDYASKWGSAVTLEGPGMFLIQKSDEL